MRFQAGFAFIPKKLKAAKQSSLGGSLLSLYIIIM